MIWITSRPRIFVDPLRKTKEAHSAPLFFVIKLESDRRKGNRAGEGGELIGNADGVSRLGVCKGEDLPLRGQGH